MDCAKTGALIRRLRLEQGLTQAALAARVGVGAKAVSKWELGQGCPDVSLLPRWLRRWAYRRRVCWPGRWTRTVRYPGT